MRIKDAEILNSREGKKVLLTVTDEDAELTDVEIEELEQY